jgi:hypothetical protein
MYALLPFDRPSIKVLLQIEGNLYHQGNDPRIALAMVVC